MNKSEQIREAIRVLSSSENDEHTLKVAEVKAVNGSTIDVEPIDEAMIYDVRLQSSGEDEGVLCTPKTGSYVIVMMISNEVGYVVSTNVLSGIKVKVNNVDLKAEIDALFDLISSLIGVLKNFQLMTSQGPTTNVMPQVVVNLESKDVDLTQIKQNFGQIFKEY